MLVFCDGVDLLKVDGRFVYFCLRAQASLALTFDNISCSLVADFTYLPTYLLTYLPTYLLTCSPNCLFTCTLTCICARACEPLKRFHCLWAFSFLFGPAMPRRRQGTATRPEPTDEEWAHQQGKRLNARASVQRSQEYVQLSLGCFPKKQYVHAEQKERELLAWCWCRNLIV